MKSFFQENKKTILIVGGISVSLVAIALLLPKKDTTGGGNPDKDSNGNQLDPSGHVYDPFGVAMQLFDVMSSLGKNSATVLEIIKNRVPANGFGALKTAFGTPKYNWLTGGQALGSNRGLIYWIKEETTTEHYTTIKSWFPNQPWI